MSPKTARRVALLLAVGVVASLAALPSSASAASLPKLGSLPTFNGVPQLVALAQGKGVPVTASPACSALSPLGPLPVAVVDTILPIDVALSITYTGNVKVGLGAPRDPAVCVLRFDLSKYGLSAALRGRAFVQDLLAKLKLPPLDPASAQAAIKDLLDQAKAGASAAVRAQITTILSKLSSLKPAQLQDMLAQLSGLTPQKVRDVLAQVQKLWGAKATSWFNGLLETWQITLPGRR